jgi:N-acyl-D-aspartate/D-glutamate deacylase
MLDYAITNGMLVDGTGSPPLVRDIGVRDGRIVTIAAPGELGEPASRTLAADGLLVTPGFVDPHTHYDAQLCWDGAATPSSLHGVTSVFGGNCGFTLAPLRHDDGDYIRRMMSRVEGMPIAALELGAKWDWESFGDYLDGLEGNTAVNAGFLVGHCALRRYVMGAAAVEREATAGETAEMVALLHRSLDEGGLGLSTTRSSTHSDGDGNPVASRVAGPEELLALCGAVGEHEGTTLEGIVEGCLKGFTDEEADLLASMSAGANRPLNWNLLNISGRHRERALHQLLPSERARAAGGRVVALTMPVQAEMNMSFGSFCALWLIPGWSELLDTDPAERARHLRDPATRESMLARAKGTPFSRLTHFGAYRIGDTISAQNKAFEGRLVEEIAAEKGIDPFACLAEIVIEDGFKTVLWPLPADDGPDDWALRAELWDHPDVLLGGSDAGAHLDRMLGSSYPTRFLADTLRGRKLVALERAVQLMTDAPARLLGLRDRGRLAVGYFADIVVLDAESVDSEPARRAYDLPGDSLRLTAGSRGVLRVLVNGVETIVDGQPTGTRAGRLLRSGRDTYTVRAG